MRGMAGVFSSCRITFVGGWIGSGGRALRFFSYPDEGYEAGSAQIGLAYTEDESLHHWTRLDKPVLSWKGGDDWERAGLYKGCLIENRNRSNRPQSS